MLSREGLTEHLKTLETLASGTQPEVTLYNPSARTAPLTSGSRCEIPGASHFGEMISLDGSRRPDLFLSNVSDSLRETVKTGFTIGGRERGSVTTDARYKSLNGRGFTSRVVPRDDACSAKDLLFRSLVFKWKPSDGPYSADFYRVLTVSTKSSSKYVACYEAPRSKGTKVVAHYDQISSFFQVSARFNTQYAEHDYILITGDEIKDVVGVIGEGHE